MAAFKGTVSFLKPNTHFLVINMPGKDYCQIAEEILEKLEGTGDGHLLPYLNSQERVSDPKLGLDLSYVCFWADRYTADHLWIGDEAPKVPEDVDYFPGTIIFGYRMDKSDVKGVVAYEFPHSSLHTNSAIMLAVGEYNDNHGFKLSKVRDRLADSPSEDRPADI